VLDPLTAPLSVASEPAGATVLLDGRIIGTTPLDKVAISPGHHVVAVRLDGYLEKTTPIDAIAGQPMGVGGALTREKVATTRKVVTATSTPSPTPEPPVQEGDLVELGPDVTPPRKISGKTAYYPSAAMKDRLEGKVTVELVVNEKGEPTELSVVESAGERAALLDEAVVEAIRKWRYEPAQKNGVRVKVRIREWQRFELRKK
jgi:TonB family protein